MDLFIGYINIIWIILLLLIVNRQVFWAGLYNMLSPIIMAGLFYSWIMIDFSIVVLFIAAYLAQELTNFLVKKIYASQILKHVLIVWFTILLFFWVHYPWYALWYVSDQFFLDPNSILFVIGYIILFVSVTSKLFAYGKWEFNLSWLQYVTRFFILTFCIVRLISSHTLLAILSGNLWMILFITIALIVVWMYDGLQIKEIIRFRKLIWNQRTTNKYNKK